jgi:hypothetical protein
MIGHKNEEPDWTMWLTIVVAVNVFTNVYLLCWLL